MVSILIVEDASGVVGANAYISEAYATNHHTLRGNTKWNDYSTPQKESAIIRACDYIDKRFGRRFRGFRTTLEQGLEWPRLNAFDNDGYPLNGDGLLPKQLQKAAAEYALRAAIVIVLAPDPLNLAPPEDFSTGSIPVDADELVTGPVLSRTEKVGPLEESHRYMTPAQLLAGRAGTRSTQSSIIDDSVIPEYPEADLLIEWLLRSPNVGSRMMRGD